MTQQDESPTQDHPILSWRMPVIILLDDHHIMDAKFRSERNPISNAKFYIENVHFRQLRKFRMIDQKAQFKKKMEYLKCLEECPDGYSICCFVKRYPFDEYRDDYGFMKKLAFVRGWLVRYFPKYMTNDRSFMLSLVKQFQICFRYASEELRSDRELLEAALDLSECDNDLEKVMRKVNYSEQDGTGIVRLFKYPTKIFKYVTCEKLRNDTELKRKVKEGIKSNRELVKQGVKHYGAVIRYSNSKFKNDPEIVRIALENRHSNILDWSNTKVMSEIALQLVTNKNINLTFLRYYQTMGADFWIMVAKKALLPPHTIPNKFFTIREIVEYAKDDLLTLKSAFNGQFIVDDEEIFQIVTKIYPTALKYASDRLTSNLKLILPILKKEPELIEFASEEIRSDISVAKVLVSKSGDALKFFDESIQKNPEIIQSCISSCKLQTAMEFHPEIRSNRNIIYFLVNRDYSFFQCATIELKDDLEFVKKLCDIDWKITEFISENLNNVELLFFSMSRSVACFENFSRSLRERIDIIKDCVSLALKKGVSKQKIYENIICRSFGKKEFKNELILLHQQFSTSKKPSLQYAHPMLYFDREYFISIYGETQLDYCGEYALFCMDPNNVSSIMQNFPSMKSLEEGSTAYFDSRHLPYLLLFAEQSHYPYYLGMVNQELIWEEHVVGALVNSIASNYTFCYYDFPVLKYVNVERLSKTTINSIIRYHLRINKSLVEKLLINVNDDTEFMTSLVHYDGSLLIHASERLKADKEFVRMAVSYSVNNLIFSSEKLKCDYEFIMSLKNDTNFPRLLDFANKLVKKEYFLQNNV